MSQPVIVWAAIKHRNRIYKARRYWGVEAKIRQKYGPDVQIFGPKGFIDSRSKFHTQFEAIEAANQIPQSFQRNTLTPEDLWPI